jgi:5-methylcytosine-specific restriction endonuclease McrA
MSAAADLVAKLAAAGTPPELLAAVAEQLFAGQSALAVVEGRRAKDCERQSARRELLPEDWDRLRVRVFERDGFACTYCGAKEQLQCDHIIPLSLGGNNSLGNLTTACKSCNSAKGARTPEQWRSA